MCFMEGLHRSGWLLQHPTPPHALGGPPWSPPLRQLCGYTLSAASNFRRDALETSKGLQKGRSIVTAMPPTSADERTYDYIICGYGSQRHEAISRTHAFSRGGTAGCVLASRLAEDPAVSVLLVEAGGPKASVPASAMPAA